MKKLDDVSLMVIYLSSLKEGNTAKAEEVRKAVNDNGGSLTED